MPLRPRKAVAALKAVPHGGIDAAEMERLGIDPAGVLDFSVSTNPFMPPPGVREALAGAPVERYPDSSSTTLRRKLSERLGAPAENIVMGNGSTELIRLAALAYLRRGDAALVLEPTYGEYEAASRLTGARVLKRRPAENDSFQHIATNIARFVAGRRPRCVFLCNPNNPTGQYLSRREVETIRENIGDGLLVLDEAYAAFVENAWDSIPLTERGDVIVLRSMTKDYGLPGLRLGYAVACREIAGVLRAVLPPWNVNSAAQAAGAAALEQAEYLARSLVKTREASVFLAGGLARLGLAVLPSRAHYFLVNVGDAAACRLDLLRRGCLVRDCYSFGLPEYVRVSPRSLDECEKLLDAFGEWRMEGLQFTVDSRQSCPFPEL